VKIQENRTAQLPTKKPATVVLTAGSTSVATKEKLKIWPDRLSVMDMMRNVGKPRERTFSDVLDEVFGLRDA
jgi:hypothetical protein